MSKISCSTQEILTLYKDILVKRIFNVYYIKILLLPHNNRAIDFNAQHDNDYAVRQGPETQLQGLTEDVISRTRLVTSRPRLVLVAASRVHTRGKTSTRRLT